MTPTEFIAAIAPSARASSAVTTVPASFTIAQAILESSWGLKAPGNNLFGIKADSSWRGATVTVHTHEVINGERVAIDARFRAYANWQGSMDDHGKFLLQNRRYNACFLCCEDSEKFAHAIAAAGYATDPDYAEKIISIIRHHNLKEFDT